VEVSFANKSGFRCAFYIETTISIQLKIN